MMDTPASQAGPKTVPGARDQHLRDMANCIRFLTMDAVQQAKSGHPGAPMGMADIATVLFCDFMNFDSAQPHWIDRDRFIMSNGHGSMLLYSLLYLTGYKDMPIEELKRFRQVGSKTPGPRNITTRMGSSSPLARLARAWRNRSAWRWASES
jgi:transketolase